MERPPNRGVSSLVGAVSLVALVVVLATAVLAGGMAMASLDGPPPSATIEADDAAAACAGCGPHDQVLRLHHRSGDPLAMSDLALVVSVSGHEQTRLVDLPLDTNCLRDAHVGGPDLFDGRCGRVSGPLTAVGPDTDGTWSAGETATFRLRKSAVRLAPGEEVTISVVHTPSGSVVAERTVSVVASG